MDDKKSELNFELSHRVANDADLRELAELNLQLIQDEKHSNEMGLDELENRMRSWIRSDQYKAILFQRETESVAYALYRESANEIYLRQFFVCRDYRRKGVGSQAAYILKNSIWPKDRRLLVEVLIMNQPAIAFWKSVGYEECYLGMEILPDD